MGISTMVPQCVNITMDRWISNSVVRRKLKKTVPPCIFFMLLFDCALPDLPVPTVACTDFIPTILMLHASPYFHQKFT